MDTVGKTMPDFAAELRQLISSSSRPELAHQVDALPLVARCRCGQANCANFYTAPPPQGAYGAGHVNVMLEPTRGLIVLDVVNDRIVGVEVLDRPDVKSSLDANIPPRPTPEPTDWRLQGQERYLKGVELCRRAYRQYRTNPHWEHDHCDFCSASFGLESEADALHEGYCTLDEYHWICIDCFVDFERLFAWRVVEAPLDG